MRYIIYCLLVTVVIIGGLFLMSKRSTPKSYDFSRFFANSPLVVKNRKVLKLRNGFHYIAGVSEKNIFLGDKAYSGQLFTTDYNLDDGHYMDLNVPDSIRIAWKAVKIFVNYPDVFLMERITPTILRSTYPKPNQFTMYSLENQLFHHPLPMAKNAIFATVYDPSTKSYALAKSILDSSPVLEKKYVLEQQNGIIFSSNGKLTYDPVTQKAAYIHFYHNNIICLDANLNLLYKGKTIDPINEAQLKMDTIHSENKMVLSSPPLYVNKQNSAYNGNLYIRSNLMARNEDKQAFEHNIVIDVYELTEIKNKYRFSFYLLTYKKEKFREFKVFNNYIVSLQGEYLVVDQFKIKF